MIKVIFFDVGGTLVTPEPSVGAIYSRIAKKHGIEASSEQLDQRFKVVWTEQKKNRQMIDEEWWKNIVWRVFEGFKISDPEYFFKDLYDTFREPSSWRIFSDVLTTLSKLKTMNIRLAVASNWDSRLPALLQDMNLYSYFEKKFISYEIGFTKPNPRFFTHALEQMGVNSLEALHVGDDEEEDVQCAEKAGMRAYLIDRKKKPINSRMINSLEEILWRV